MWQYSIERHLNGISILPIIGAPIVAKSRWVSPARCYVPDNLSATACIFLQRENDLRQRHHQCWIRNKADRQVRGCKRFKLESFTAHCDRVESFSPLLLIQLIE